tara:strand:- start:5529 stop:5900 length:372 start_codon:yes stop_codon:yes gene_type:complete
MVQFTAWHDPHGAATATIAAMPEIPKIRFVYPGGDRFASVFQAASRQPSWVMRAATITFLLVVGIPIMLLLLLAAIVATTVFAVLIGVNRVIGLFTGRAVRPGGPDDARRQNVRVIPPSGKRR